jgi:hypothetical protein
LTYALYFAIIMVMNVTYKPEALLVKRDGEIDHEYYEAIYAEKRRVALHNVGNRAVELVTLPVRNLGSNILDLVKAHSLLAK